MPEQEKDNLDDYQKSQEKEAVSFDVKISAEEVVSSYVTLEKMCSEKGIEMKDLDVGVQREMLIQTCQNVRDRRLTRKVDERRKAYIDAKKEYWANKRTRAGDAQGNKRRGPTEKMKKLLMDRGYASDEVDKMSFEQAGKEIERIKKDEGW